MVHGDSLPERLTLERGRLRAAFMAVACLFAFRPCPALDARALSGDLRMHDPSTVVRCHGRYWVFSTGPGISVHSSADGYAWRREAPVFESIPADVRSAVPKNDGRNVWAPDVAYLNGTYHLYYAVSTWASEVSAIGLATSPTLDPAEPGYHWTDRGVVVRSMAGERMNTIDPCVMRAPDGSLWLTYGSYIGTVNVIQLDPKSGLRLGGDSPSRPLASDAEASALIHRNGYYYLFVNRGTCCRGPRSTYHIMMGRARAPTGPFLDRGGRDLLRGGGTLFLGSADGRVGPGHFGLLSDNGADRFSMHYEADAAWGDRSVLDIRPLLWDGDGWPRAGEPAPRLGAGREPGDVAAAPPGIPARRFALGAFGAVGDGRTDNTRAFERAIAAVRDAGGGTLQVPPGRYLTGPLTLCSRIELRLDPRSTILFSSNPADYARQGRRLDPQLSAAGLHDIVISGSGTFDGQGGAWWPAARAMRDPVTGRQYDGTTTPRPPMIVFARCDRVRVEGVTLTDSPALNLGFEACRDVAVDRIGIYNPADSPNTDCIDPKACQRVLIERCWIDTGDDCIAAGGGPSMRERGILISDCDFFHGHGCSIGSGTTGGVADFTVRRCLFDGTQTGIRLKSARGRGGLVENLVFADLTMTGVGRPISIDSSYEGTTTETAFPDHVPAKPVTRSTPEWRRMVVRNLVAREGTGDAGLIVGLPEMPVEALVLDHVTIEAPRGLRIGYSRNLLLRDVDIRATNGGPLLVSDTVSGLRRQPQPK